MISREQAVENLRNGVINARKTRQNSKHSLADEVYSVLLQMLINKELPPGTVLNRRDIAKKLGVSVAPVLEAIIQLDIEGYLVSIPRKGTIVAPIGLREIYEHMIMREALECQAARLYCGGPIRNNYEALLIKAASLDSTFINGEGNWNLEYEFHGNLVELCQSEMLINEFNRVVRLGTFYGMYHIYTVPGKEKKLKNHHELLSLLAKGDPDIAEKAVREHLLTSKIMLLDELRKNNISVLEMEKETDT